MTSGQFSSVDVNSIFVMREDRQRKTLENIEDLAESINRIGLIQPPVITREGQLIAGERRWTAIKSLGWTHIPVQFVDELEPHELEAIELEENVKRKDLTWQEECEAIRRYHANRSATDSEWSPLRTAEALGYDLTTIHRKLGVAEAIVEGDLRVAEADKFSTARNIVERSRERKRTSVLASIMTPSHNPDVASDRPASDAPAPKVVPLINYDFRKWVEEYVGVQFNFLHCDFPYGVGMHKSDQGAGQEFGTYEDDPDVYWQLLDTLALAMSNVIAPSAHLMFWFSMDYYEITRTKLEEMGWRVNPFPLMWMKSDNTGIIPDANRGPRRIYETAFFASRGDRKIVSPVSNAFAAPGRLKEIHMNEKPVEMLQHFMRMAVDEYSMVLDPTCGSGNALKAAEACNAKAVLGIEKNPEFFQLAYEAYHGQDNIAL